MPDAISDSGDVSASNLSSTGSVVLQGYAQTFDTGVADTGTSDGKISTLNWSGSPLMQAGVEKTVLTGGVDINDFLPPNQREPLTGGVSETVLTGGISQTQAPPVLTTQVVKADIKNTVVQPIEPCRSIPYLKLVFLPVDETVRSRRDLRRETSIPVPRPRSISVATFKGYFTGNVSIKDTKYVLRWKQVLPVVVQPQDSGSVDYKSVDVYDFRTSVLLNSQSLISNLDFSQLPLTQVSQASDIQGGTTDPDLDDYELYLADVIYADLDLATGKLIAKDPVAAGIFPS